LTPEDCVYGSIPVLCVRKSSSSHIYGAIKEGFVCLPKLFLPHHVSFLYIFLIIVIWAVKK